ncbi:electron transfer flavoprotein subunit beta/FixA family protein [Devosia algicola]|uniref:Electron transfer flavoprotein subunit beta n=1 Tax=Devosia algicola TaxID=3026418 RepID=A0ABY7YM96_9HYPH|nr:electron transfer flavoprotein subunit beta/FixA family protein [Devosia algicola]WDR02423.1 electron transfer flavoprotein subunit beta/FixA family protein [Devosia algicola]
MKILVAVKRVVDHNVRIRVRPDGSGVETSGVRMSMNPFCKHAVEAAVQLGEAGQTDEITVVSIGPKPATDVILTALAMGAHRGILVETEADLETLSIAKLLAAIVSEEQPDLVLLGKQAVDDDSNHVGQMLAGLLDWPQATFASELRLEDGQAQREPRGRFWSRHHCHAIACCCYRGSAPEYSAQRRVANGHESPSEKAGCPARRRVRC